MTASSSPAAGSKGVIEVEARNLAQDGGELVCALYDRAEAFPGETGVFAGAYAPVRGRAAVCRFEGIPAGRYAVAAFHDQDGDRKLKTFLGMPREGYGFSMNAQPGAFGPPKFAAAAFDFDGTARKIAVEIRYP